MPFQFSCLSATKRRSTAAKRDDLHSKSLFLVKNKGQWNAKSGPKAAYGNFAMRTKFSGRLESTCGCFQAQQEHFSKQVLLFCSTGKLTRTH